MVKLAQPYLLVLVFIFCGVSVSGEEPVSPEGLFTKALDLLKDEPEESSRWASASALAFEAWKSPSGWYNSHHAWILAGQKGRSAWALRTALTLEPWNLKYREAWKDLDTSGEAPWGPYLQGLFFWLGVGCWNLFFLALAVSLWGRVSSLRGWFRLFRRVTLVLSVLSLTAFAVSSFYPAEGVLVENTDLRKGNHEVYEKLSALNEGLVVRVLEDREGWLKVASAGQEGWIEQKSLLRMPLK